MSNEVKKGLSFVKQVVARLKGDDAEVTAQKIARKAISAVEGQLAALNAKQVDLEGTVEDGIEALNNAKYPTTMITDNQSYIRQIQNAQRDLDQAQDELKDVEDSIKYFQDLLKGF